jgi:hypothetical protein
MLLPEGHLDKRELHGNLQKKYGSNITLAYLRVLLVRVRCTCSPPARPRARYDG